MSAISVRVLDTSIGRPAAQLPVRLARLDEDVDEGWQHVADAVTDVEGRADALGPEHVPFGRYRVELDTAAYFATDARATIFPEVSVVLEVADGSPHHLVVLLTPFGHSVHRG